jgi:RNA polymerase sigma-70 factor, ECF subfamily
VTDDESKKVFDESRGANLTFTFEFDPGGENIAAGIFVGGYIGRVTPVPIPNTVVKPAEPMILLQRESRSLPALIRTPVSTRGRGSFFAPPSARLVRSSNRPDRMAAAQIGAFRSVFMDTESNQWLEQLRSGPSREATVARLHALLLRISHAEANRRAPSLPAQTVADLDDLCMQAVNDAVVAITRKLDAFQGLSRFTTWASKFVILEISSRLRRHAWRHRRVESDESVWDQLMDSAPAASDRLEQREQLQLLREAVKCELTDRQRLVFTAVTADEIPIDVLAERLGSSRGAIYKILHDSRLKLQRALSRADSQEALP